MLSTKSKTFISLLYSCPFLFLAIIMNFNLFSINNIINIPSSIFLTILTITFFSIIAIVYQQTKTLPKQQQILSLFLILTVLFSPFGDYILVPLVGVVICLFFDQYFRDNIFKKFDLLGLLWLLLVGICLISATFAIMNKFSAVGMSLAFLMYGILFKIGRYTKLPNILVKDLILLFSAILIITLLFSLYHLFYGKEITIGLIRLYPNGSPGLASIFSNWPANTAGFLVMSFSILSYHIVLPQYSIKQRSLLILGALIVLIGILFTETRMALLFLAGFGGLFLILYPFQLFKKVRFLLLLAPILIMPLLIQYSSKWQETLSNPLQQTTIADRLHQYQYGIKIWQDNHQLLGVGLMNFSPSYNQYGDPLIKKLQPGHGTIAFLHNIYLSMLVETGILGFSLFLVILILLFMKFWHYKQKLCAFFGIYFLTGLLCVGLVDNWLFVLRFSIMLFPILGYTLGNCETSLTNDQE